MNRIRLSSAADQGGAAAIESAVAVCGEAPAALQRCATGALDRCTAFTANLELAPLVPVLDVCVQRTVDRIAALVESLGHFLALQSAASSDGARRSHQGQSESARFDLLALPQATLQRLLRLPLALAALQRCTTHVDTEVRTRASALLSAARAVSDGAPHDTSLPQRTLDVVAWRLNSGQGEVERVTAWERNLAGVLLPKALAALAALEGTVDALLTAALCAPSRKALAEVRCPALCHCCAGTRCECARPGLRPGSTSACTINTTCPAVCSAYAPHHLLVQIARMADAWAQDASVLDLAAFHPFPSPYATAVGDDLMGLPPLLEVLVPDSSEGSGHGVDGERDGEGASLASRWLDRAASALAGDLRERVLAIRRLGSKARSVSCQVTA
jgi:hypothetical protein